MSNSVKKIFQGIQLILASLFFLSAMIFFIQIIHPAPYWENVCDGACNIEEQKILTSEILSYSKDLRNIFYGIAFIFIIIFLFIGRNKNINKHLFFTVASLSVLFSFFSNTIYKWYFGYGTAMSAVALVVAILGALIAYFIVTLS